MEFWHRAKTFAEEAANKTTQLTKDGYEGLSAKSQDLTSFTISSFKISDIVSETAKKSKEYVSEATDQIKVEAFKRVEIVKTYAEGISPQMGGVSLGETDKVKDEEELEVFGVSKDLREFVKGITISTFKDFPMEDEPQTSDVPTVSNVRQDLTEWQERHAILVLTTVKEISRLRFQLCPRFMKERKFWRIYFILVNTHVALYEKRYMEQIQLNSLERATTFAEKDNPPVETPTRSESLEPSRHIKTSTSSAEQDLDIFLLGDLGSSDEGQDDAEEGVDEDFDKISEDEDGDEKQPSNTTVL